MNTDFVSCAPVGENKTGARSIKNHLVKTDGFFIPVRESPKSPSSKDRFNANGQWLVSLISLLPVRSYTV